LRVGPFLALLAPLVAALATACGSGAAGRSDAAAGDSAITLVDDVGRTVRLAGPAHRVVSLKPSLTETLIAIGATGTLVGRTDFDEQPELQRLPSTGGNLEPNMEVLASVHPDLVLVWESTKPGIRERIEALGIPTFAMQSLDTTDIFRSFRNLGRLIGKPGAGDSLATSIRAELDAVAGSVRGRPRPSTFVVVWNDPPMTAGPDTYLGQLISLAGGEPSFPELGKRFGNVALEEIVRRQPQVVVLPQGEDDKLRADLVRAAPGWRDLRAMRGAGPARVPSDLVSRAGPNLGEVARRLRDAIHPEAAAQ
jgi:iron complex transport system substrate-binding protein